MKLSGPQLAQIQEALLSAFPSRDDLEILVLNTLGTNLEEIVASGQNLRVVVFKLVTWAERNGRIVDLLEGAHNEVPGNPGLSQLVQEAPSWPALARPEVERAQRQAAATQQSAPTSIDVFLSYSRHNTPMMRRLYADLRNAGFSVWTDEGLEAGTASWKAAIEEAVQQARCMVVIMTPESKASTWVNNEIGYAAQFKSRIFPVLASGDVASAVPIDLINVQWVDVRQDYEHRVTADLMPALVRHIRRDDAPKPEVEAEQVEAARALAEEAGTRRAAERARAEEAEKREREAETRAKTPHPHPRRNYMGWWIGILAVIAIGVLWDQASRGNWDWRAPWIPSPTAIAVSTPTATSTNTPVPTATATSTSTPVIPPAGAVEGAIWTNPVDGAEYAYVPAGEFLMGSDPAVDALADDDEFEQTKIKVDGFWLMRTEVTNAQYRRFVEDGGYAEPSYWTDSGWQWLQSKDISLPGCWDEDVNYSDQPVRCVTWYEVVAYTRWLSVKSDAEFRLPTEAEWEKACRGTDGGLYPWGDEDPEPARLNYVESGLNGVVPVGSYPPGAHGLYDMAGNVWEWTSSKHDDYPYADDGREDPEGENSRTVRGGAFRNSDLVVRCARRDRLNPSSRHDHVGFRVVVSPGR